MRNTRDLGSVIGSERYYQLRQGEFLRLRRQSFDRVAEVFDKTRGPPENIMKRLINRIVEELEDCKTILDAGVGTGRFAKPLQNREIKVVGIDISQRMMAIAKVKGTTDLIRGDLCALPFKDRSFDATICNAVLHLIPEWKIALHEICRVTERIMVSTIHERDNPIRDAYALLREDYGYKANKHEKPIQNLTDAVPSKSIHVASYSVDVEESLEHFDQRVFSHQWSTPESVNKEIVSELRKRFSGKKLRQGLRVLVWNVPDLNNYLSR